jgi:hypothetical protein
MKTLRFILMTGAVVLAALPVAAEVTFDGFLQTLVGGRLDNDNPTATEFTAQETRFQLRAEHFGDAGEFFGRLDFTYDGSDSSQYDFELREGYLKFRLGDDIDVKLGRQVLTWGTGDLIFINDVFAKDYRSFFVGRNDQYLKAPQNALRVGYYSPIGALSVVWTPRFEPNRLPTGRNLSYFNGQSIVGEEFSFYAMEPEAKFENGEWAARLNRRMGSFSVSGYFYHGFYKNPMGAVMVPGDPMPMPVPVYPRLNLYGASARGPIAGGIVWVEGGYYDSRDDRDGDNPLMPNSQIAILAGFERQVATNLTANIQWLAEHMLDWDTYRQQNESMDMFVRDETRQLLTTRITKLAMEELLTLSAFVFYSPTDEDMYARFSADYKYSDEVTLTVGGNIFDGNSAATQFGQFQLNDNLYGKVTYGF